MSSKKKIYKKLLRTNIVTRLLAILVYLYLHFVYFSSKKTFIYSDKFNKTRYKKENAIYAFWHNRFAMMFFLQPKKINVNVLISNHRDNNLLNILSKLFGTSIITGSSNEKAMNAIKEINKVLKNGESLVITPDGPRGPMYSIKSNIIKIAANTSSYVIPGVYSSSNVQIFRSWDHFIFPLPFGKISFIFGNPISPKKQVNNKNIKDFNLELKQELDRITQLADNFAKI